MTGIEINNYVTKSMNLAELLNKKKLVVTGANGFIGRALVDALVNTGARVTVILRSNHGAEALKARGVTVVLGQLNDPQTLRTALDRADVLFNLAYDVRASKEDNLAAFEALLKGAQNAGVKRIVHASSIVVYDGWPHSNLTENSPVSTITGGPYRQAKIAMERRLESFDIPNAILQPTLVYGPMSAYWTVGILEKLRQAPVVLPDMDGICSALYVDDLAQAFLQAAVLEGLASERFIISGSERLTWPQYYAGYQEMVPGSQIIREPLEDLKARLGPAPADDNSGGAPSLAAKISLKLRAHLGHDSFERIVGPLKRLRAGKKPIYPDRGTLELLSATGHCSITHAKKRLGYAPVYDFERGLAEIKKR